MQADENGFRAATTRVVHIEKGYGGKGQFIRLAGIENGCVKWLIFGLPKMPPMQGGGGGGGGMSRPYTAPPIAATVWLVCGTAAVDAILAGATQEDYSNITNALREALLMRSGTKVEIEAQQKAINNALKLSGPKINFKYTSMGEAVKWWKDNFGFLYEQSVWTDIWANTYGP